MKQVIGFFLLCFHRKLACKASSLGVLFSIFCHVYLSFDCSAYLEASIWGADPSPGSHCDQSHQLLWCGLLLL